MRLRLSLVLLACAMLALCAPAFAAVGLSISPTTIDSAYVGRLTFTITGLTAGQAVNVEKYLDVNGDGVIQVTEPLAMSFKVTDGVASATGGVANPAIPGDTDGAVNSQITTSVAVNGIMWTTPAKFVFQVCTTANVSLVTKAYTVTAHNFGQSVSGVVRANSVIVPNATVILMSHPDGVGLQSVITDGTGYYTVSCPPGVYRVVAFAPGRVTPMKRVAVLTVQAGQSVTQDLTLTQGTRTITGKLVDKQTSAGIPGAMFLLRDRTDDSESPLTNYVIVYTNRLGEFTTVVTPGLWSGFAPGEVGDSLSSQGYVCIDPTMTPIDTTGGNVTGAVVPALKATGLLYGTLKDAADSTPIAGAIVDVDLAEMYHLSTRTGSDGSYALPLFPGEWKVCARPDSLQRLGYLADQPKHVPVHTNQAVKQDLVASATTAHLSGHVVDNTSAPVGGVLVKAQQFSGTSAELYTITTADGSFDFPVNAGAWQLSVDQQDAFRLGLFTGAAVSTTVINGVSQSGFTLTLQRAAAQVSGFVKDNNGIAVPFIRLNIHDGNQISYATYTDATGAFSIAARAGSLHVQVNPAQAALRGLFGTEQVYPIYNGTNLSNQLITLMPATAHLRGSVKDNIGTGIPYLPLDVFSSDAQANTVINYTVRTTNTGAFDLPVIAGTWVVTPNPDALKLRDLLSTTTNVYTVATGVDQNNLLITLQRATAHISGTVMVWDGTPLPFAHVSAYSTTGASITTGTFADDMGHYQLGVIPGTWNLMAEYQSLAGGPYYMFDMQQVTVTPNTTTLTVDFYADPPLESHTPDLLIRNATDTQYTGDNILNEPAQETVTQTLAAGLKATYYFKVQNDGFQTDTYLLSLPSGVIAGDWTVKIYDALTGGTDITNDVFDGTYQVTLAKGTAKEGRIEVTVAATVPFDDSITLPLTAVWENSNSCTDTVQAVAKHPALTAVTMTGNPASPTVVGMKVNLIASPNGGNAIRYWFRYKKTAATVWTDLLPYGTARITSWTPQEAGSYMVQVLAKEATSTKQYDCYKVLSYTINPVVSALSLTAVPSSPTSLGITTRLTATATGGGTLRYWFRAKLHNASIWTDLQAYNTYRNCLWRPLVAGDYDVQVLAKETGSTNTSDISTTISFSYKPAISAVNLTSTTATPTTVGTAVPLTATVTGGGTVLYWFRLNNGKVWSTLQAYSTSKTFTWTPTAPGTYLVQVMVKEAASAKTYDAVSSLTYYVKPTVTALSLNTTPASPSQVGTPVTLSAQATGGIDLRYWFRYKASTATTWTTLQAYSPTATCTWTPTVAGNYSLQVLVQEVGSALPTCDVNTVVSFTVIAP